MFPGCGPRYLRLACDCLSALFAFKLLESPRAIGSETMASRGLAAFFELRDVLDGE